MNTERSDAIIARFQDRDWEPRRIVFEYEGPCYGTPRDVFPLLCPAREADWIPTWDASVIYSETGYAAKDDVFRTPAHTGFGEGVWVFVDVEQDRFVELVQVTEHVLVHLKVSVAPTPSEEGEPATRVRWDYVLTSLTPEGAATLSEGVVTEEKFQGLLWAMDHYLRHGEMVRMPAGA